MAPSRAGGKVHPARHDGPTPGVPRFCRRAFPIVVAALACALAAGHPQALSGQVQFVFLSDTHYGITRPAFRGASNVDARIVNQALVASINALPETAFADDGGVAARQRVGAIDFVVVGGDIVNRAETFPEGQVQSAHASWLQFVSDYRAGLTVTDRSGHKSALYVVPGNHEASNAVGFYKPMVPAIDRSAVAEIYNWMMAPATPRTASTYNYARDKVWTTRDVGGVHFMFLSIWPDTPTRAWMARDLGQIDRSTPAIIFTHDQPDAEAKHFINPNGSHDINATDRFENLLADRLADGKTIESQSLIEQGALEAFFRKHPNVTAYFHGNSNWNEFYDWTGPRHSISLHTFRVDSPMKGAVSMDDERKLSFQIATIDLASNRMTVRECLWNTDPRRSTPLLIWGEWRTVAVTPALRPATH